MAWKDGVSSDDLSWALSQEISNKVNLTTLNNTLLGYTKSGSITKEDLAKALQAELTGKLTGSASVGANKLASVIINGQTLIAGGYIQADLINVKDLVVGSTLSIGAFSLNSYNGLNWTGSDYFGNTSFRLTVGGGYTYNTGTSCKTMVGAWSNSADTHACISGICNTFGVAYMDQQTDGDRIFLRMDLSTQAFSVGRYLLRAKCVVPDFLFIRVLTCTAIIIPEFLSTPQIST